MNNELKNKFEKILEENEKIISIDSASSKPYVWKRMLIPMILSLIATLVLTIISIANPWKEITETQWWTGNEVVTGHTGFPWFVTLIVLVGLVLLLSGLYVLLKKAQSNYFVCLTEKRIIIRKGMFKIDYNSYNLENVSGNIVCNCSRSVFDNQENSCSIFCTIELLPVGHNKLFISFPSLNNGYDFAKSLENIVHSNSKSANPIKE